MERAVAARRAMGCTPSKAAVVYSQEQVCPDLDTCSTFVPFVPFVPGLKSSAATPETRRLRADTSGGRRPFLRVPYRDVRGRSVSQSSPPEPWSSAAGSSQGAGQSSVKPRSQTPDLHVDSEGCWTS